jgi:hypothetical protein
MGGCRPRAPAEGPAPTTPPSTRACIQRRTYCTHEPNATAAAGHFNSGPCHRGVARIIARPITAGGLCAVLAKRSPSRLLGRLVPPCHRAPHHGPIWVSSTHHDVRARAEGKRAARYSMLALPTVAARRDYRTPAHSAFCPPPGKDQERQRPTLLSLCDRRTRP